MALGPRDIDVCAREGSNAQGENKKAEISARAQIGKRKEKAKFGRGVINHTTTNAVGRHMML